MYEKENLKVLFLNSTLKRSPRMSHTNGIIEAAAKVYEKNGASVDIIRVVDHDIRPGVYPDMTEQGRDTDARPEIYKKVKACDILILCTPIWLGQASSECQKIIERLYAHSGQLNEKGQYTYYGKVGGTLITGNEDGIKHCAMGILYSLQHVGFTIPPQADAGWIGEAGPGASYLDEGSGGPENDFTNRNTTFMVYNTMHQAAMLKQHGGIPKYGTSRTERDAGTHYEYENPEYRS